VQTLTKVADMAVRLSSTQGVDSTNQLSVYTGGDALEGPGDGNIRGDSVPFNLGAFGAHIGRDRNHQPIAKTELTCSACHETPRCLHSHNSRQTVFLGKLGNYFCSAGSVFIYQDGGASRSGSQCPSRSFSI
jgi:hypothetical protein